MNEQATKAHFLQLINQYPVIHLATHAWSDAGDSRGSRIFFYPGGGVSEDDNLYLPELYGLNMDSTELVILSACESGKGETVDNEGIISLSRGFMYAGCASTVNSLWKADDESTAFILARFHGVPGAGAVQVGGAAEGQVRLHAQQCCLYNAKLLGASDPDRQHGAGDAEGRAKKNGSCFVAGSWGLSWSEVLFGVQDQVLETAHLCDLAMVQVVGVCLDLIEQGQGLSAWLLAR